MNTINFDERIGRLSRVRINNGYDGTEISALPDMKDMYRAYAELLRENTRLRELGEKARSNGIIYNRIAHALARGCTDLFYVNMVTDEYIEFHTDDERGVLNESRRANDFFESCAREAKLYVYPEDQAAFVGAMNRQFLTKALERSRTFELTYRRIKGERTFYVQMKVTRMEDDDRFIVVAVSDIDELVRKRRAEERMQEERIVYARLHAITGNFVVVYVLEPETGSYREFSATDDYKSSFSMPKAGDDYFTTVRELARQSVYSGDRRRFLTVVTLENVLSEVQRNGIFSFGFRLMMEGRPIYVQMKAAMVEEKEGPRLIVGLNDIDAQVRQEKEMEKRLALAESQANIDALTGVKNRHAYLEAEARMDHQIAENQAAPFAIVILDVNDLKKVNDTAGHQAGDQYLRDACRTICDTFKHSPVFRVGGDEFAVIAQGKDYAAIENRIEEMRTHNDEALRSGGIVIACGMAEFEDDGCVATVFERADHNMYTDKNRLKSGN